MDAFEQYGRFLAMRNHFTSEGYDAFKYNFKVRTNHDSFMKRNDRYLFHKLSKHDDPDTLMVANFMKRDKVWVNDLFDPKAEELYTEMKRRHTSLKYTLKNEMNSIPGTFNEIVTPHDGQYPILLREYLGSRVSPESMVIIDSLTGVLKEWDKRIADPVMWPQVKMKLEKYKPFVRFNKDEMKKILVDIFNER